MWHGTHTTVSAVGASLGYGRGVAPGARLVFQAIENYVSVSWICSLFYGYQNGYYLTGVPSDLNQLFQQAYDAGARIHSNSWGAAAAGAYDTNSANADAFVWNHRDMVITFSAGNEGIDANSDGVIDNDSIAAPGTAKNVITVGASENDRAGYPCDTSLTYTGCTGSNESIIVTYGTGWGYPADPIKSDSAVGNEEQMAAFSSRGPTDDGRIKPDVVAPGTYVLSGYSNMYQQQNGTTNPRTGGYQYDGWAYPESTDHKYLGGTSMSNPLVAGGAAVVRDYYAKAKSTPNASAALIKATIINSAHDQLDENNDGADDNDFPIPNIHEGWGRVDLAAATDGNGKFIDNTAGLGTNGTATYTATAAGGPLKITLVWSDYPSSTSASINLVNDLDLSVTAPGGSVYRGNVFSSGWSQTGGSADRRNNIENVYISNAGTGNCTIQVTGYNVPNGPQPFAIVVRGATSLTEALPQNPVDPTVTFTGAPASAPYNSTFTVSSTTNSSSPPQYTSSGACSNSGPIYTVTSSSGICTSTVSWDADSYYNAATLQQITTATKADPTVSFTGAPASAPINTEFTVSSTTNSTSPPQYTSSGACTNSETVYTTAAASGTCTSTVTWAADNNYYSATRNQTTQVGAPPPATMHVGNFLTNSQSGRNYWVAGVSTTIHDANHQPVEGARINATWSNGYSGTGSCTTNSAGWCQLTTKRISNSKASVTFTVTNVTKSGVIYDSSKNHSSTGGNGTSVVVMKP